MARPVVATPNALQGIPQAEIGGVRVTSDPATMARFVVELATQHESACRARQFVQERYTWERSLAPVSAFFEAAPVLESEAIGVPARIA